MWTEKYRPAYLNEVAGHEEVKDELKGYIRLGNPPHLLFCGPPGVGKTSIAVAFARDLLGDAFDYNFLELNASDERGIDTVKTKIKNFCRTMSLCGGLKIILLDEADYITDDAQAALRRLMEKYPKTRFILTANSEDKIMNAIKSRCRCIGLKELDEYDITDRLKQICEKEGMDGKISYVDLIEIAEECKGDLRNAINTLQGLCMRIQQ